MSVAQLIAEKLNYAVKTKGFASFVVSGGSSPLKIFEELSNIDILWSKIQITLVDDRLVDTNNIYSNEKLINDYLLINKAKLAQFIPLTEKIITKNIIKTPFDINLLGMGVDGHFASLFPDMINDFNAFDLKAKPDIFKISSHGDPFLPRITMNLSLILKSEFIILLVKGSKKESILDVSLNDKSFPIHYLLKNRVSNFYIERIND